MNSDTDRLNSLIWPDTVGMNDRIPEESRYGYPTGWICPKCGRVYGPFMDECTHCNKPDYTVTCIY